MGLQRSATVMPQRVKIEPTRTAVFSSPTFVMPLVQPVKQYTRNPLVNTRKETSLGIPASGEFPETVMLQYSSPLGEAFKRNLSLITLPAHATIRSIEMIKEIGQRTACIGLWLRLHQMLCDAIQAIDKKLLQSNQGVFTKIKRGTSILGTEITCPSRRCFVVGNHCFRQKPIGVPYPHLQPSKHPFSPTLYRQRSQPNSIADRWIKRQIARRNKIKADFKYPC